MNLSKDDIIEVMTKAHSLGASHMKMGEFEIHYMNKADKSNLEQLKDIYAPFPLEFIENKTLSSLPPTVKDEKFEDLIKPVSPFDELSDEEVLYWGTAYGDELIAKRLAREEELKTETRATGRNRSKPQGDSDVQEGRT